MDCRVCLCYSEKLNYVEKMSNKRTTFKKVWLNDSEFTSWLKAVKDNIHQARCTICMKTFELSNMGRTAVSSHNRSVQHQKRCSSGTDQHSLGSFVTVRNASTAQSEISVSVPMCHRWSQLQSVIHLRHRLLQILKMQQSIRPVTSVSSEAVLVFNR